MIVMKHIKQVISITQSRVIIQKMYGHKDISLRINWQAVDRVGVDLVSVDPNNQVYEWVII